MKATGKLRKTLYPLTSRRVAEYRQLCAAMLRADGVPFRGIRQVLRLSGPEEARKLVSKFNRKRGVI